MCCELFWLKATFVHCMVADFQTWAPPMMTNLVVSKYLVGTQWAIHLTEDVLYADQRKTSACTKAAVFMRFGFCQLLQQWAKTKQISFANCWQIGNTNSAWQGNDPHPHYLLGATANVSQKLERKTCSLKIAMPHQGHSSSLPCVLPEFCCCWEKIK